MSSLIVLILAGGRTTHFAGIHSGLPKALIPVNGRPILDYVLQAAIQSRAEQVYIVQDFGEDLQHHVLIHEKCEFIDRPPELSELGDGVLFGLVQIARNLEPEKAENSIILVLPCDIPLITGAQIDRLVEKARQEEACSYVMLHDLSEIQKRFPHKKVHFVYSDDFQTKFAWQVQFLVDGKSLKYFLPEDHSYIHRFVYGMRADVNRARKLRRWQSLIILFSGLKYLRFRKLPLYIKPLVELISGRMRYNTIKTFVEKYLDIKMGFILSECVEFSGDIDNPLDFQEVLGIPLDLIPDEIAQNRKGT